MRLIDGFSTQQRIQWLAVIAALSGVALWSSLLLAPGNSPVAAPMPSVTARADSPVMQWFANQPMQTDIKVSGVMAGARGAVAILILNDQPPRSFMVGEQVTSGVRLAAIDADSVLIERGKEQSRLTINKLPATPLLPALTRQ
ncbi:general secretion pathway protein GspC [Pseudomonas syringae]|nr:general secretion pathway protein GspC [Pseudomonas syringae]MCQ3031106.1 general secretion pathway protein GspC [Pseudomonas syringae]